MFNLLVMTILKKSKMKKAKLSPLAANFVNADSMILMLKKCT